MNVLTIDQMAERLEELRKLGHGNKPCYAWLPGQWIYPALPVVPPGQDHYAMIELNVCPGQGEDDYIRTPEDAEKRPLVPMGITYTLFDSRYHPIFSGKLQHYGSPERSHASVHLDKIRKGEVPPEAYNSSSVYEQGGPKGLWRVKFNGQLSIYNFVSQKAADEHLDQLRAGEVQFVADGG